MPPCHTVPFVRPGVVIGVDAGNTAAELPASDVMDMVEHCDYCGSAKLEWRKCKLICTNCRQINKSCADL
jgi:hypothetical protein